MRTKKFNNNEETKRILHTVRKCNYHFHNRGEYINYNQLPIENLDFFVKSCIFHRGSLEGDPVNLRTCLRGSFCRAHAEPFNHWRCAEEHQYTLTQPKRHLPHWQDNVLLSIAVNVKVFTPNIQNACLGVLLLRAQGSPTQCSCYGAPRGFAVEFMCPLL